MPENTPSNQEKLGLLRKEIAKQGLDGFILPRTDEYQGEFLAPYAERLSWLSGFTGSAGFAVILKDKAVVMSDGRYTIQLRAQVDGTLYELGDSTEVTAGEWIAKNGSGRIGYDPWLQTAKQIEMIRKSLKDVVLVAVERNPVDAVWADQPARPAGDVCLFPDAVAGRSSVQKRMDISVMMKEKGADALILSQGDSICWLLNVRGADVPYSPLVLSYAVLYQDGVMDWFIDLAKVPRKVEEHLAGVTIRAPQEIGAVLAGLKGKSVWLDGGSAPLWFLERLHSCAVDVIEEKDPCAAMKAIKSPSEQAAIRDAHVRDAVAMVRFMRWLEAEAPKGNLNEIIIADQLEQFRKLDSDYAGESFGTIAGFRENGAIIHYRASRQTNKRIEDSGLLLLDSGGQYSSGGTTDITRTFAIGKPSQEMRENYTRVLKGHIALSRATFPAGTTGAQIDTLARASLWEAGLDYAHGTGHGVGCFLGVHEEAASISPRGDKALCAGMLLSNEPGYYKEGAYGIRIENLILVVDRGFCADTKKQMLGFEVMTLVPYEMGLIEPEMLTAGERAWLIDYYGQITSKVLPLLGGEDADWLSRVTAPLL